MKKIILTLFLLTIQLSVHSQSLEEISFQIKNEINQIIQENKKEEKIIPDRHYTIKITSYGPNLVAYNKIYQNYYNFTNTYLVKNDIIFYSHEKGQMSFVFSGEVSKDVNYAYGDLFEIEYYFIDKNKGYKFEKRVTLFSNDIVAEKQKELDSLAYTITEIGNSDYNSIYKYYSVYVRAK